MARPLSESEYLYGLHDAGGEAIFREVDRSGWIVFNECVGQDPKDPRGVDFARWSDQGYGIICRLNHGFPPDGTIPHSSLYEDFARRVASFVAGSRGCRVWVIGNEMNYAVERPGVQIDWSRHKSARATEPEQADPQRRGLVVRFNILPDYSTEIRTTRGATISPGEVITPELYARCYRLCRDAIHRLAGHEDDLVLVGAVAPWNTQTIYPGNPNGDWVQYFRDILVAIGPANCDGFTLHTYTHGADPALITAEDKLPPPFQQHHREFRAYTDFLAAVPDAMRTLPVFITETDQTEPWADVNDGWVQAAYAEIDGWNRQAANQQIHALALYRWPKLDRWYVAGKTGVLEDLRAALRHGYRRNGVATGSARSGDEEGSAAAGTIERPPRGLSGRNKQDAAAASTRDEQEASPRAAPRESTRVAKTPAYRAQWLDDRFPNRLAAGQVITATVTVKNAGSEPWQSNGDHPFRLAYRYYRNRRQLALGEEKDLRTELPADVLPGESVTVPVRIALPDEAGNYTLEVDVVHEGIAWLKEQGSPVLARWLTVEAPRREARADGSDNSALPVPLFSDVTTSLPRAGTPYARRELNQIKYIVVSHTGGHPRLGLERIAETHIQYGYPGIVYNFVVDSRGQVYKVTNLEEVAQPDKLWSEQGVNVCLTGNFTVYAPPLAQLDAAGRLCAWLAQNLGMAPDSIVGMGELTKSDSPGDSFYRGPAWKGILSRQVRLHLAAFSAAGDTNRINELTAQVESLRVQNRELETQLAGTEDLRMRLDAKSLRLQAEVEELRRQMEVQAVELAGGIRIVNWTERLPRDDARYCRREVADVQHLVIHHTGVPVETPLPELAELHRREWPGILYDFVIDAQGEVHQTQPLDEVVETDEPYLRRAVGVAFAGVFDEAVPSDGQIAAGARLIGWLLDRFPQLGPEQIQGLSELTDHPSPGRQWLQEATWKERLLAAVEDQRPRHDAAAASGEKESELRLRAAQLEHELQVVQRSGQMLLEQKNRLQNELQRLQAQASERQQETRSYVIPQPAIRLVTEQLPKHPTLRYERRPLSQITHIAIHHTATPPTVNPIRIAELHVAPDPNRGKEAWPGIGYHFFIHPDGAIDQTNVLETASYHVHRHNMYSIGIVFAGSFMNGKIPSSAQLRAGAHLTAWLMQELNVPLARVWGHREFPDNTTVCPGSEWTMGNRWRDLLFERIEQTQAGVGVKSIRHYLLFWQRPFPGPLARQDFVNAINYIVRFRPVVGFSVQDARNAEYVTVVGGEAGISAAEERLLQNAGCRVERIAGRDEEETSRILAELAALGRRFRAFDADF